MSPPTRHRPSLEGSYTVQANVSDAAGNPAVPASQSLTVDKATPSIAIAPIAGDDTVNLSEATAGFVITGTTQGEDGQAATVTIVNSANAVVDSFATAVTGSAWTVSVSSAQARALADGSYTVQANVSDVAGNPAGQATRSLTIHETAPNAPSAPLLAPGSDSGVSATDGITNDITPVVTGSGTSGDTITLFDTDGATVLGSTVVGVSGIWSITPTVSLSEGPHSLTVTDKDVAGNTSSASAPLQVVIDTIGPNAQSIVSITASPSTAVLGVGATVTLTLTLDQPVVIDPNGSDFSFLTLNDGGIAILTGIDPTNTVLTASYTVLAGQNTADLAVTGFNLNGATGTDLAGNPASTIGFAINPPGVLQITTTAPPTPPAPTLALSSDSGVSDTDGITNVVMPTITGAAASGDLITLFDTDGATVLGVAIAANGTWSITPTVALTQGTHSLTVTDQDVAGNTSLASTPLEVTIDLVGPNAGSVTSVTSSPSTADLGVGSIVTLTITLNEPVIIDTTQGVPSLRLNDGGTAPLIATDTNTTVLTASYTVLAGQNTADLAVTGLNLNGATITDAAGNPADADFVASNPAGVLQIDTTPPAAPGTPDLLAASDSGASNTDNITDITTPVITGAGEVGATVTLLDGRTVIGSGAVGAEGTYSITTSILGEGAHTITATQTDAAGNTSAASAALSMTIDTTLPVSWIDGTGTWNTGADWSTGAVPASTDDVLIAAGGNYTVTLSGTVAQSVNTLIIDAPGATLNLQDRLAVTGGIAVDAGTLDVTSTILFGEFDHHREWGRDGTVVRRSSEQSD